MKRKEPTVYIGLIFILIVLLLITNVSRLTFTPHFKPLVEIIEIPKILNQTVYGSAKLKVPAVDNEGNGVVTYLTVEARPGKGRVLTDVNNLLFWIDTQYSIRIAQRVAQNITKMNLSNVDLIYAIETEAEVVEGPSAGAALTIATIAALENKTINESVMITGTINPDGTIGAVGGIIAKGNAAKDVGAKLFLVPYGQGTQKYYKPIQHCEKIGLITWCETTYEVESIDVTKDIGIEVKEVRNIEEALKYFIV